MFSSASLLMLAASPRGASIVVPPSSGASMTVSWTDNSSIETGYRVRYRIAGSGSYTLGATTGANATTTTLTGLAYGTNYDVTVASFLTGNSPEEYSQVGPVTRYTPPEFAPTGLTAGTPTDNTVPVTFTATTPTPTGYLSQYKPASDSTWIDGPSSSSSPITFSGLSSETTYNFQLRAYFANSGQTDSLGPWSGSVNATTVAPIPRQVVTSSPTGSPISGYTGWVGFRFTITEPITITSLSRWGQSNVTQTYSVKVWSNSGTQLASANVNCALASGSEFVNQSITPLILAAGTYIIASLETEGVLGFFDVQSYSYAAGFTIQDAYGYGDYPNAFGVANQIHGPVGFLYTRP